MFGPWTLVVQIFVGLATGWLAGKIVRGADLVLLDDMVIGLIGACFGTWLLAGLGNFIGIGLIATIINAAIGAIALLAIIGRVQPV